MTTDAGPIRHRRVGRWVVSGLVVGLRHHWFIACLVGIGATVRILVMVAYQPAFWFANDSADYLRITALVPEPDRLRPLGYPVLLALLEPTGSVVTVVALQHLAGLGLAVGIYALLLRRGLPRVVAGLAAVPVLLDSLQVDLEHFVLAETLFTVLLVAGVTALLWRDRPGALACAVAGLLLALAWFTRPIALCAAVLLGGYLLLRRVGVRRVAAFAAAFVLPWAAVVLWVGDRPSPYGSDATGIFLYGRTAIIADCDRLQLPPEQRPLCPTTPIDPRLAGRADWYIWVQLPEEYRTPAMDPVLRGFAVNVMKQQPGDYLAVVAREMAPYFLPYQDLGAGYRVVNQWWTLPASVRDSDGVPALARPDFDPGPVGTAASPGASSLTRALYWYGVHVRTPALFTAAVVIAALFAVVLARRRPVWRDARDAGLLTIAGVALLLAQVALSMYEPRYGLPTLPLFSVAAALGWRACHDATMARRAGTPHQVVAMPVNAGPSSSSDSR